MFNLLGTVAAQNAMNLINVGEKFDKITGAEHGDLGHTSHDTQNN